MTPRVISSEKLKKGTTHSSLWDRSSSRTSESAESLRSVQWLTKWTSSSWGILESTARHKLLIKKMQTKRELTLNSTALARRTLPNKIVVSSSTRSNLSCNPLKSQNIKTRILPISVSSQKKRKTWARISTVVPILRIAIRSLKTLEMQTYITMRESLQNLSLSIRASKINNLWGQIKTNLLIHQSQALSRVKAFPAPLTKATQVQS